MPDQFWIRLMETLGSGSDLCAPIPDVLHELCAYFGFGCGFLYRADHAGRFSLAEHCEIYENTHMPASLDLPDRLGPTLLEELEQQRLVVFRQATPKDALTSALEKLFQASSLVLAPVVDEAGSIIALLGLVDRRGTGRMGEDDVTYIHAVLVAVANHIKLVHYQQRVDSTKLALESMLDRMGIDIYVNDFTTHEILYVNHSMAAPYGGKEQLLGKPCWQVLHGGRHGPCDFCPREKLLDENGNPGSVHAWDYRRAEDNAWFRMFSSAFYWVDGRLAQVVSSVDITETKRAEETIRHIAEYDPLTGLPNRNRLSRDCDNRIPILKQTGQEGYMLFFDLDGFKNVNDTMGHHAGDELLTQIGHALQEDPLTRDICYRHGGDEFVLFCGPCSLQTLRALLDHLQTLFSNTWTLSDGTVKVGASIGLSNFPLDGTRAADLLRSADMAMYAAKRAGRGLVRFYNGGNVCNWAAYVKENG